MPIGFDILATADVNPVVLAIGGFNDGLIEIGVRDEPVEPAVQDVHIGMRETV